MNRGKKVVFVSHCLLNQNTRSKGMSEAQGGIKELMELLSEAGVGVIQLPCPQFETNGGPDWKLNKTCDNKAYRSYCKKLSADVLLQIKKYLSKDYKVLGILGVEFSGTCAVFQTIESGKRSPGKGILMEEIEDAMRKKNFQVPLLGVNLNNIYSSVEKVQNLLKYT